MSEAESLIKCGAEIYSNNNQNNNEGGSEEESTRTNNINNNWTKLSSFFPTPNIQGSGSEVISQSPKDYTSPVRPFGSSESPHRLIPLPPPPKIPQGHQGHGQLKNPNPTLISQSHKKIRLPLTPPAKSGPSGKNRKDSSIPVGIAVARQRHVTTTPGAITTTNSITIANTPSGGVMSSQPSNPTPNKSKRTSPNRPAQSNPDRDPVPAVGSPVTTKTERSKKAATPVTVVNRSNSNTNQITSSGIKRPVSSQLQQQQQRLQPEPTRSNTGKQSSGNVDRSRVTGTPTNVPAGTDAAALAQQQQQRHLLYAAAERAGRLAENGVGGNKGHEFPGYTSGFTHNPHFGDWTSQLNVPHLPPGYNTAASAAAFMQQHQQLTMHHPEIPLQLSQSFGYNLSPYHLYSGYPAESILQYEQFFRQQQLSREELSVRQQQQQQQQHQQPHADYDNNRLGATACRSLTPLPSLSPRVSIPSPSPNSPHPPAGLNLYPSPSNHPQLGNWQTDLYQHGHYFTSSTATLSPRSLTSSTPSPVTVHDTHSYLMARKCITPNPIGVTGSKHFPFSSPFSPSLLPAARDVWKDHVVKIRPKPKEDAELQLSPEIERSMACKTPGGTPARHDFRRMESLIEKREDTPPIGRDSHSPVELDVEDIGSCSNSPTELDRAAGNSIGGHLKTVCDGMKLRVPENLESSSSTSLPASMSLPKPVPPTSSQSAATFIGKKPRKSQPRTLKPKSKNENDTQQKNDKNLHKHEGTSSEKYFIPVKREFYGGFNNSSSGSGLVEEEPCNYSTKSQISNQDMITSQTIPFIQHKSNPVKIDISRVKKEVIVENIYVKNSDSSRSRTSAAGDTWRSSRRPETERCSGDGDNNMAAKSSSLEFNSSQEDLNYFGKGEEQKCDSDIIMHQDSKPFGEQQQQEQKSQQVGHNMTVTVSLPPPTLDSVSTFSSPTSSASGHYDSDIPPQSFPKIVISSAESHLNLLATVAQEIGPYISMNTSRSPRRYESLIQIEPTDGVVVGERRSSASGSIGSTATSLSRVSIDEYANFSPTAASVVPANPIDDEIPTSPRTCFEAQPADLTTTTMINLGQLSISTTPTPTPTPALPYQLKIPQVIGRLDSKKPKMKRTKEKDPTRPVKPKKIKTPKNEKIIKVAKIRSTTGKAGSTKIKKPKINKTVLEKPSKKIIKGTTGGKGVLSTIKKESTVVSLVSEQKIWDTPVLSPKKNPCIYDFDDSKPNLEPLYNRLSGLEKSGHPVTGTTGAVVPHKRRLFGEPIPVKVETKMAAIAPMMTPGSLNSNTHDLKSKSKIIKDKKEKNNDTNDKKKKAPKTTIKNEPVTSSSSSGSEEIKKKKKPKLNTDADVDTITVPSKTRESTKPKPKSKISIMAPLDINKASVQPQTMQIQSILSTMSSQLGHGLHDSSSNESSKWVADPAHAITAFINVDIGDKASTPTTTPPRRISGERALKKRRKAMKPSKLSFLNGSDHPSPDDSATDPSCDTQPPTAPSLETNLKSQLKSFVHFTTKKKNGHNQNHHHHIKPCLKAEPEFRGGTPTSEESDLDMDLELDLKPVAAVEPIIATAMSQPKPAIKIRKPSIDMNIFSRRVVRMSEDGDKEGNAKTASAADLTARDAANELVWNKNVVIAGVDEMLDEMRILTEIQGLFYTGKLNALQPPDVYGVTLDNERGAPPHLIYSAEEVLEKCIREAKPWKASQLPHGLRICAYWSPQYSGLYPGKVSTDYDTKTDLVPVEFDDGDTGVIKIGEIRLLAADHPIREYDPNPLLTLEKKHRKRRHSSATGSQSSECNGLHEDADCGEPYCAKVAKMKESEEEEEEESSDGQGKTSSKLMYWTWSGLGYKRPGTKKNRNKEFYHGIQRGDEVISVGDSALFISNGNVRPFLGRVERFWEKKGKKIVNVRWFYHPEEVKTKKKIPGFKYPGALFESPHIDENDVQTIAKKCEVLPFEKFREKYGHRFTSKSGRSLSSGSASSGSSGHHTKMKGTSPKDTYYLAGYYDPYNYKLKLNDLK